MNEMTEWKRIDGATNAPAGYHWENNGKSRFGGEYEHRLVKDVPEADQPPAPIREGDIVEITGAYFKNDNGLWLVIHANDAGDALGLRKLGKTGKLLESGNTSASWPLRSYCSDPRKNAEAERHNAEHAKLARAEGVPTWYAAEYFRKEAEWMAERAEKERSGYGGRYGANETGAQDCERAARRLAEIADRLAATAEQPKQKAPETGIRFYWNGIKVDGGKLVPCFYSLDNNPDRRPEVHIMARNYGAQLPRQYFTVTNETDSMTDYFDADSARLTPEHPLYKFARYAAVKNEQKGQKSRLERAEKALAQKLPPTSRGYYEQERAAALERLAALERETDPGQPTAADLAAVAALNTAEEPHEAQIVKVEASPQLIQFAEARKRAEQRRQEQAEREIADLFDAVELLTDEQLEAAVLAVDRRQDYAADVARFFLQALARRDKEKALDVYRRWKSGA